MPEPNSGCWLWTRCVNRNGYGIANWFGKARLAHRISYELHCAPVPPGLFVCHRCDNPTCVNPTHLFVGTAHDNVRDMDRKQRRVTVAPAGERHHNSKLTTAAVRAIRASGVKATTLARLYCVTPEQIRNIKRGAQRKEG
jgi:hypothetical protein